MRLTAAAALDAVPSFTVNVKLSAPTYVPVGVYVKLLPLTALSVPWLGCVAMPYVSGAPFEEVPASVITVAVALATVTDCAVATGGVYGGSVTVAVVPVNVEGAARTIVLVGGWPTSYVTVCPVKVLVSVTEYVKLSVPLKPLFGV